MNVLNEKHGSNISCQELTDCIYHVPMEFHNRNAFKSNIWNWQQEGVYWHLTREAPHSSFPVSATKCKHTFTFCALDIRVLVDGNDNV